MGKKIAAFLRPDSAVLECSRSREPRRMKISKFLGSRTGTEIGLKMFPGLSAGVRPQKSARKKLVPAPGPDSFDLEPRGHEKTRKNQKQENPRRKTKHILEMKTIVRNHFTSLSRIKNYAFINPYLLCMLTNFRYPTQAWSSSTSVAHMSIK